VTERYARGSLWWVNHDPALGSEAAMTRPALVVSSDALNPHSKTLLVCPLTSSVHRVYSFEVFIPAGDGNLERDSKAQPQLLRAVDKQRLQGFIGVVSDETLALVTEAIALVTGMRDAERTSLA
jgi:mRNA interferase MazF